MSAQNETEVSAEERKRNSILTKIQKSECMKSFVQLKRQECVLEKGLVNLIDNMKLDADVITNLSREERELSANRDNVLSTLRKTVSDINDDVKRVKMIVSDPEKIRQLDVNEFKSKLIGISKRLNDFKGGCPLRGLTDDGNKLDNDLKEFSSRLHRYDGTNKTTRSSSIRDSTSIVNNYMKNNREDYEEIEDLHTLIVKTGYTEHWSNEDHLFFLKMRKKYKSVAPMVNAIRKRCPDMSIETIINHETWYKLYLELRDRQRSKINEWRRRKELNKTKGSLNAKTIDVEEDIGSEMKKKNTIDDKVDEKAEEIVDVNADKKELIKKWKLERENKRVMELERTRSLLESKRVLEERRARIRKEAIRESLREYRRNKKKSMDEVLERTKEDGKSITKEYDPTLIREFRKQDEEYIRKRRISISRANKIRQNKLTINSRISKSNGNPSTLLEPTKAWREKCKIEDSKEKDCRAIRYIKDVPKLYTRWRNEESIDLQNYFAL